MRFHPITAMVEPIDEYRKGGYHPVHIGDEFHNGRYKVLAKLSFGASSTIWLARDNQGPHREITLKIHRASASKNNQELTMHQHLSNSPHSHQHAGRAHITELLDHFYVNGPNGTHLCLVFPATVADLQTMMTSNHPRTANEVRCLSRQILRGLGLLHRVGIVLCDLRPGNIMIAAPAQKSHLDALQPAVCLPVEWRDGVQVDDTAPRYLVQSQRYPFLVEREEQEEGFERVVVVIGDLGGAQWINQCDEVPVTELSMRAPEVIGGGWWDERADIWGLGCLIYELATNRPLFSVDTRGVSEERIDEQHLALIERRVGADALQAFAVRLGNRLPKDFGVEHVKRLAEFLWLMLQIGPTRRWSVGELLETPFIVGRY
ncbi:kinase-like protein [Aspergillus sclerotiicarbonarius CBS 121057]|uniref:non-specific serine/threonine protein kinase n=1 Tax=Aspergillus sclerotiicarbonarius (strain CBS 121057 / IBT 28362) TaxID=1448318 RepID=A0A319ELA7_ASPSB|nr:kinase-like protein [Aspergillus sclerotiicarbonarius CBS 121057]